MATGFRSASSAQSISNGGALPDVAKPAGVVQGDVMFAAVVAANNTGATIGCNAPSGWTLLQSTTDAGTPTLTVGMLIYYKIAGASEPSTYTFTPTNSVFRSIVSIVAYSSPNAVPVTVGEYAIQAQPTPASTAHPTPAVTVAGTGKWAVGFWADISLTSTSTSGVARVTQSTSNVDLTIADSNGPIAAGSKSFAGTLGVSSSAGVTAILTIATAAATSAPVASGTPDVKSGMARVLLPAGTAGGGGTLAWSAVSAPAGTEHPSTNVFLVPQRSDGSFQQQFVLTESPSGLTDDLVVVIPQLVAENVETVMWNGTGWE